MQQQDHTIPVIAEVKDHALPTSAIAQDDLALTSAGVYILSLLLAVLIPSAGIYVSVMPYIDMRMARRVDPRQCVCNCWDGLFKGEHNVTSPLSIYFNMSWDTLAMIIWAFVYLSLLKELVSYVPSVVGFFLLFPAILAACLFCTLFLFN